MKITPDTNILVRALVSDNFQQTSVAIRLLKEADLITLSLSSVCELVWVLRRLYKYRHAQVAAALEQLANAHNVVVDRQAFEAGMTFVQNNGDFADGVIAYEGRALGGETFASFDEQAVRILTSQGHLAKLVV